MKHEIHQFQKLNPGLKQADLIGIFSKQFKFDISSSTMSDILKQKILNLKLVLNLSILLMSLFTLMISKIHVKS